MLIRAFKDEPISATVTRTAWSLNVKSRTLRAEIDLPNTGAEIPGDLPDNVRSALAEVKLPQSKAQILPGMYAYGNVIIRHPNVWTLRQDSLDYWHGKTIYWSHHNDRAVRMEVQTGVSDGEWTEITNCRPLNEPNQVWSPINGSETVIVTNDLSTLTEGEAVQLTPSIEKDRITGANAADRRLPLPIP